MRHTEQPRRWSAIGVAAVCLALLLSACTSPTPISLGQGDSGHPTKLAVGQQLTVQLPSNATTGYSWAIAGMGGLKQVGKAVYDAPNKPGVVGAAGTETFTFAASSRGAGQLTLEYRRPWEKGVPAAKTWSVPITIE